MHYSLTVTIFCQNYLEYTFDSVCRTIPAIPAKCIWKYKVVTIAAYILSNK